MSVIWPREGLGAHGDHMSLTGDRGALRAAVRCVRFRPGHEVDRGRLVRVEPDRFRLVGRQCDRWRRRRCRGQRRDRVRAGARPAGSRVGVLGEGRRRGGRGIY